MGKNPNAARLKKNHRQGNDDAAEDKMAALADEAAKLNCEVWEVEKVKAQLAQVNESDSSDEEEESKVE